MCQMSVVYERDGFQEKVMENVTSLEVVEEGLRISTFFEEPRVFAKARLEKIDFLNGTVFLRDAGEDSAP